MCIYRSLAADYAFSRIPGPLGPTAAPTETVTVTEDRVESVAPPSSEEEAARVFFPESWIFQLLKAE